METEKKKLRKDLNKKKRVLFLIIVIVLGVIGFTFDFGDYWPVGILLLLIVLVVFSSLIIPRRCSEDGTRFRRLKIDFMNTYYKCEKGHILRVWNPA